MLAGYNPTDCGASALHAVPSIRRSQVIDGPELRQALSAQHLFLFLLFSLRFIPTATHKELKTMAVGDESEKKKIKRC